MGLPPEVLWDAGFAGMGPASYNRIHYIGIVFGFQGVFPDFLRKPPGFFPPSAVLPEAAAA